MRMFIQLALIGSIVVSAGSIAAHHPADHEPVRVWPRIDVIGPLGNKLPPSYRRSFQRPSYLGGKIAHTIAPSSQEAIAWHRSDHAGLYDNNGIKGLINGKHCPPQRVQQYFFYPKPWEVLNTRPRPKTDPPVDTPLEAVDIESASDLEILPLEMQLQLEPLPADEGMLELTLPEMLRAE